MASSQTPFWIESRALIEGKRHEFLILKPRSQDDDCPWEFPGGRVERRESPEAALRRLLRDICGVEVELRIGQPPFVHNYGSHSITFRYYICSIAKGTPTPPQGADIRWVQLGQLRDYHFDVPTQQVVDWMLAGEKDNG